MASVDVGDIALNLRRIRGDRGLTQEQLADAAGISRAGYRKVEAGESSPRGGTVLALARALEVKPGDLLRPAPPLPVARFRSTKKMRERQRLLMRVATELQDYTDLEMLVDPRPRLTLPRLAPRDREPTRAALRVREAFRLKDDEPIHGICGLLEGHGIKVLRLAIASDAFFGLSVADGSSGPAIVVNV